MEYFLRVNFLELSLITDEIIDLIHAWNVNEQYLLRKLISDIKKLLKVI